MAFLQAVSPAIAIYSAGAGNSYGHPAPITISNLNKVGAKVYGTDVQGNIIVTVDDAGYHVETGKTGQPMDLSSAQPTAVAQGTPVTGNSQSGITVVSLTNPVSKGAEASLTIKTSPGSLCSITVYYKSGPSKASGLEPKTADASGLVSWQWSVGVRTTSGNWPIEIKCGNNSTETSFTVQ